MQGENLRKIMGNKSSTLAPKEDWKAFDTARTVHRDTWMMEIYSSFIISRSLRGRNLHWEAKVDGKTRNGFQFARFRTPHLVNGFLFTLRLIAGIFSSLWVDGLRLPIFLLRSYVSIFHWNDDDGFVRPTPHPLRTQMPRLRIHTLPSVFFVINWISSFETGSLGFLRHDMIILRNINEKYLNVYVLVTPVEMDGWMDGWTDGFKSRLCVIGHVTHSVLLQANRD